MTERTIDLDQHRGMAAQKATDIRRLLAEVEANEKSLRLRQAGFVLRVRSDDGVWVQTVKSRAASDGRFGRGEWETRLASPYPDVPAALATPSASSRSRRPACSPRAAPRW